VQSLYGIRFKPIGNVDGMLLGLDARWFGIRGLGPILLAGLVALVLAPADIAFAAVGPRCVAALSILAAVLLTSLGHELGHVIASRLAGLPVRAVVLAPEGGVTIHSASQDWTVNVLTALGGPLANAAIGGACVLVMLGPGLQSVFGQFIIELAVLQLLTAGLNLLPCGPMDGRRIVAAYRARQADC
jgi:Zn-dependent protease